MTYPTAEELTEVIDRTTAGHPKKVNKAVDREMLLRMQALAREVPVPGHVKDYAVRLVLATHPGTQSAAAVSDQYLRFGSSPRGAQTMILAAKVKALTDGRFNVSFDDIKAVAPPALRHRLILNFEAQAEAVTADHVLSKVLEDTAETLETARAAS